MNHRHVAALGATFQAGVEISSNFGTEFRYGAGNLFATFRRVSRRDSAIMLDRWIFATPARFRLSPFPSRRTRRRTRVARSASNRSSIFAVSAGTFMSVPLRTRGLRKASMPKRTDKKTDRSAIMEWNGTFRGPNGPRRDKLILVSAFYPRSQTARNALRAKGSRLADGF